MTGPLKNGRSASVSPATIPECLNSTSTAVRSSAARRPRPPRRQGKSDPLDAVSAARAAQSGRARGAPKGQDGAVEANLGGGAEFTVFPNEEENAFAEAVTPLQQLGVFGYRPLADEMAWEADEEARARRTRPGSHRRVERTSRRGQWIHFLIIARRPLQQCRIGRDAVEVLAPLGAAVFADPGDQFVPALIVI